MLFWGKKDKEVCKDVNFNEGERETMCVCWDQHLKHLLRNTNWNGN